MKKKRRKTCPE